MKFVILLILLIWDDEDSVETNIFGLNVNPIKYYSSVSGGLR